MRAELSVPSRRSLSSQVAVWKSFATSSCSSLSCFPSALALQTRLFLLRAALLSGLLLPLLLALLVLEVERLLERPGVVGREALHRQPALLEVLDQLGVAHLKRALGRPSSSSPPFSSSFAPAPPPLSCVGSSIPSSSKPRPPARSSSTRPSAQSAFHQNPLTTLYSE